MRNKNPSERAKPDLICLGQIGAAHGIRGEVRLRSFTAVPEAIADYGPLQAEDGSALAIESLRPAKGCFIATIAGIRDRNAAEALANARLYVPRDRLPEPAEPDEFYYADLVGLTAVDRAGKSCGTVIAVHNFGAGDIVEIRRDATGKTELLPFDAAHVPEVDLAGGRVVIELSGGERLPSPARGEG